MTYYSNSRIRRLSDSVFLTGDRFRAVCARTLDVGYADPLLRWPRLYVLPRQEQAGAERRPTRTPCGFERDPPSGGLFVCAIDTPGRYPHRVIDPAPASGVPNGDPSATGRTRVRGDDAALASRLSARTSSARHVRQPAIAPASRPAILRHRVPPSAVS